MTTLRMNVSWTWVHQPQQPQRQSDTSLAASEIFWTILRLKLHRALPLTYSVSQKPCPFLLDIILTVIRFLCCVYFHCFSVLRTVFLFHPVLCLQCCVIVCSAYSCSTCFCRNAGFPCATCEHRLMSADVDDVLLQYLTMT